MTPKEVLALCRKKNVKAVDLRFTDLAGKWHRLTIPIERFSEDTFDQGLGFDGSRVLGWQPTNQSDLVAVPQSETAFVEPASDTPTLSIICVIQSPVTREDYPFDPRQIATRAQNYLSATGIADTAMFGPEPEFHLFEDVQFETSPLASYFFIDRSNNAEQRMVPSPPQQRGPFPSDLESVAQTELADVRNDMMQALAHAGLQVESHHQATDVSGHAVINLRHQPLVEAADGVMIYKHVIKRVAVRHQLVATFMPKPIVDEDGSGMHTHFSLWKDDTPLFAGSEHAGLSATAMHALAGILRHTPSLLAFTNPTTNSYKRFVPGHRAPTNISYGQQNRTVACRIPVYSSRPETRHIEFRCPDPTANPYLAFSAILMAAIDGIQSKMAPEATWESADDTKQDSPPLPASLGHALVALQKDHDYLLRGNVFPEKLIQDWIENKRADEVMALRRQPHPLEFCLYFDQ